MKKSILIALAALVAFSAQGGDYSAYYKDLPITLEQPAAPVIPALTVSVTDFGGVGDGVTLNTEAFKKAIAKLDKQGGGHLNVPAGIWLTGPISLKSRIDLHVERGAIILFTPDRKEFLSEEGKCKPGISASKRTDISITGEGIIDGNGEWWRAVKKDKVSSVEWKDYKRLGGTEADGGKLWYPFNLKHIDNIASDMRAQEKMRTHLIRFTDCERVLIEGVTVQNSPKFHIVPTRCKDVSLIGVTVRCPWNAQNGDGIDLMFSQRVLVAGCTVDVGDDGICLKAGGGEKALPQGPVKDVLIVDNTVFHAHGGFVIGSEFSAGIQNVVVRRNTFSGTDTGLRFKSAPGRGGKTERIFIEDIVMSDIRDQAIVFETTYVDVPVGTEGKSEVTEQFLPEFTDISITRVTCRDARIGIKAKGPASMIHGIRISDSILFCSEATSEIDDPDQLTLENVRLLTY